MQRIKEAGHVGNQFSEGVPGVTPATVLGEEWPNDVQEELAKVIEDRGITLADLTPTQLNQAMLLIAEGYGAPLFENLVIKNNAVNPLFQVDIDADFIKVEGWKISAVNLTADLSLAAATANGPETAEAASKWYHLWAILNITAPAAPVIASYLSLRWPGGAGAEDPDAMTLPANYTKKLYLGAVRNSSASDLGAIMQIGNRVARPENITFDLGTATVFTAVDISATIPQTARAVWGTLLDNPSATATGHIQLSPELDGKGLVFHTSSLGLAIDTAGPFSLPITDRQTLYYNVTLSSRMRFYINGWEY